jgi:uncharacterized protein (DUF302 family)
MTEQPGFRRELSVSFEEAKARLPAALKRQGFGILTNIDIQAVLKQKIGAEMRRYEIFGACSPKLAHQALEHSLDVGVMLPCNVVLYEQADGRVVAMAVDTNRRFAAEGPPGLEAVAQEVGERLQIVLGELG